MQVDETRVDDPRLAALEARVAQLEGELAAARLLQRQFAVALASERVEYMSLYVQQLMPLNLLPAVSRLTQLALKDIPTATDPREPVNAWRRQVRKLAFRFGVRLPI
jgi:hypothetical protein